MSDDEAVAEVPAEETAVEEPAAEELLTLDQATKNGDTLSFELMHVATHSSDGAVYCAHATICRGKSTRQACGSFSTV